MESFNYSNTKENYLTEIGSKVKNISKIIIKFIKKEKLNINDLDITSFFSKFIKKNDRVIKVVHYNNLWFEIDTINDFRLINSYKNNLL